MTPVNTTRRHATIAIAAVWVLVCGGLAWATKSAIQLDRIEAHDAMRKADDIRFERAMARIETEVAPIVYAERARPYSQFRSFYVTTGARFRGNHHDVSRDIEVVSPLKDFKGPAWLLLHFQVSVAEGWSSPQLGDEADYAMPAGSILPAHRATEATAENWFAALRERYTPDSLEKVLIETLMNSSRAGYDKPVSELDASAEESSTSESQIGTSETARRAERLMQLQLEIQPESSCEPELVATANLETGTARSNSRLTDTGACIPVRTPLMTPVWLDLTMDGAPQLAFVRAASVETAEHCTLQGCLIDWEQLKSTLEKQIEDLYPEGRLVPVRHESLAATANERGMVRMLNARLIPGHRMPVVASGISASLVQGLAVGWTATLLALAAITYGVLKYLALAERRMKFVAAVTHELRTPLTSFQLYSDLLSDMKVESGEQRHKYAGLLKAESRRLSRLVENVLAYSRVGDAAPKLNPQTTRPEQMLEAAREATAETCAKSGKQLIIENRCASDAVVDTDTEYVGQILTNLIENACKYSGGNGNARIWLTARPAPGDGIILEVDDEGPGVSPRERRDVFEPFRRGGGSDDRRAGGVGLGLSLSRYWAECLGGALMLRRSERNGSHFSCFSLMLPARGRIGESRT